LTFDIVFVIIDEQRCELLFNKNTKRRLLFMKSIKSYARFLDLFCKVILIPGLVIVFAFKWIFNEVPGFEKAYSGWAGFGYSWESNIPSMPLLSRMLGMLVDGISYGLVVWAILCLLKLLKHYQKGELFSLETFSLFRKISKIALIYTVYDFLSSIVMSLISTMHNAPGERMLSVQFSSGDIKNIFVVACFFMITSLMYEGCKLKEEQNLTV
jgi:hypothetical protein